MCAAWTVSAEGGARGAPRVMTCSVDRFLNGLSQSTDWRVSLRTHASTSDASEASSVHVLLWLAHSKAVRGSVSSTASYVTPSMPTDPKTYSNSGSPRRSVHCEPLAVTRLTSATSDAMPTPKCCTPVAMAPPTDTSLCQLDASMRFSLMSLCWTEPKSAPPPTRSCCVAGS